MMSLIKSRKYTLLLIWQGHDQRCLLIIGERQSDEGFKRILKGWKDGYRWDDIVYDEDGGERGLQWSRELQLAAEEFMKDVRVLENAEVFEFHNFDENEVDLGVKIEAEELMLRIKKFDEKMKMDGKGKRILKIM